MDSMIVDLTGPEAWISMFGTRGPAAESSSEFSLPWAVAFQYRDGSLLKLAGEDLRDLAEDDGTILFDCLHEDLHRIQDEKAREQIIRTFWDAIRLNTAERRQLPVGQRAVAHAIVPYQYPQPLLESFRAVCVSEERDLVLRGFINEAVAVVVGFVRSPYFIAETSGVTAARICLVVTDVPDDTMVICFDYRKELPAHCFIRIQDFFRTSCVGLAERMRSAAWLSDTHGLFSLASARLGEEQSVELERALGRVVGPMVVRNPIEDVRELRRSGATYLAACCLGRGEGDEEFVISAAADIGVQMNRESIYPIVRREASVGEREYPHEAVTIFKLNQLPEHELEVNLYSGFSGWVDDSVRLASARISVKELASQLNKAELIVTVNLKAVGHGVFRVDRAFDGRSLATGEFTLPGLVA
jgi:hypothetical protein